MVVCISCGRQANDYTEFPCPSKDCSARIVRCKNCRENSVKWVCLKCGQSGP